MLKIELYILLTLLFLSTPGCKSKVDEKRNLKNITLSNPKKYSHGDLETCKKYDLYFSNLKVINDSLKDRLFLKDNFKKVDCKCITLYDKDFNDDVAGFVIREVEIVFQDTLKLNVLIKAGNGQTKYIYSYKGKVFEIKNYFGEMYGLDSDIYFHFDTRECYSKSENIFLMHEQPARWNGLANQFEFYQIVDLNKMEITQFVDRDDKMK